MAIALEEFVKRLSESGVLSSTTIQEFIPPKASPKGAEELAGELVKQKKLTRYQAAVLYSGDPKSLVLGNYILLEKIGAGGMGQVFKARHQRMDRIVAIKLLSPSTSKDPEAIARFEREVKAAAKLVHPNIVAAHDADCADGFHFLVMEYVEGKDLAAVVKKNGTLPVDKAIYYTLQAAIGLEAAHKKGIVHRDIKPSNLLLDSEGTIKILDMGLAILKMEEESGEVPADDLTSVGKIMGTVDFMSPEQALNTHTADGRTDIYALGCTLHYILTGKAMYSGSSPMEKLMAHRVRPIPPLSALRPEAPPKLEAIYRRMVAKRVSDRYQSATELIEELREICGVQPPSRLTPKTSMISVQDEFPDLNLSDLSVHDSFDSSDSESSKSTRKSLKGKSSSGDSSSHQLSSTKTRSGRSSSTKIQNKKSPDAGSPVSLIITCVAAILIIAVAVAVMLPRGSARQAGSAADSGTGPATKNLPGDKSKVQQIESNKKIDVNGGNSKVYHTTE